MNDRRGSRRVFSLVPDEDVVLFSLNGSTHFEAKLLDLSNGGALVYGVDPTTWAKVGFPYTLYFQSCGQMLQVRGTLVRKDIPFLAFRFVNITRLDLYGIVCKIQRLEVRAARMFVGNAPGLAGHTRA